MLTERGFQLLSYTLRGYLLYHELGANFIRIKRKVRDRSLPVAKTK